MRIIRAQRREPRNGAGEGRGEAKQRKKPFKNYRRDVENGGNLGCKRKNVDEKEWASRCRSSLSRE